MRRKMNGRGKAMEKKGKMGEGTLVAKIIKMIIISALFISAQAAASIIDVNIVPILPTTVDQISIQTYGRESKGPVYITSTDFYHNGTLLELDIYLDVGFLNVVTPWQHFEDIGTLPKGTYDLTVRTYQESVVTDTYPTSFEVVPEPTIVSLICLGIPFLRVLTKRGCQ